MVGLAGLVLGLGFGRIVGFRSWWRFLFEGGGGNELWGGEGVMGVVGRWLKGVSNKR